VALLPILGLLAASCSAAPAATATPEAETSISPPAVIVAEGRLEPIRYAELALNTSGLVSEVLQQEGAAVKAVMSSPAWRTPSPDAGQRAGRRLAALTAAYQSVRDAQYDLDIFDIPVEFADAGPTEAVRVTEERLTKARDAFEPYKYVSERQLELTEAEEDGAIIGNTPKRLKRALDDAWEDYRKAVTWLDGRRPLKTRAPSLHRPRKTTKAFRIPSSRKTRLACVLPWQTPR